MATTSKSKPKTKVQHDGRVTRRDVFAETTAKFVAALKAALAGGVIPWHKPWKVTGLGGAPRSLATGKLYRGINVLILMLEAMEKGYGSNLWGTYNQMAELAGLVKNVDVKTKRTWFTSPELADGTPDPTPRGVRRGEKSTSVVWAGKITVPEKDAQGNIVMVDGKPKLKTIHPLKFFPLFNLDQCSFPEGSKGAKLLAAAAAKPEVTPLERDQAAEALVAEYLADGPSLGHGGNSAHYVPAADHVQMPNLADFDSTAHYMSTLYHELTHSTGHDSRLKREGIAQGTFGGFGSKVYSEEELVAEIGAAMLCAIAGIDQAAVFDNSAAYVAHWISKLENDNKLIYRAARDAQKAIDCILGTTFDNDEEGEG
jgi:antirestriction protein ArdC